jgi:hypothetical protein
MIFFAQYQSKLFRSSSLFLNKEVEKTFCAGYFLHFKPVDANTQPGQAGIAY